LFLLSGDSAVSFHIWKPERRRQSGFSTCHQLLVWLQHEVSNEVGVLRNRERCGILEFQAPQQVRGCKLNLDSMLSSLKALGFCNSLCLRLNIEGKDQ
jgi:hypothetical protein